MLWKPNCHFFFYRRPPLGPLQSRINQVNIAHPNPLKIELNIIVPSAPQVPIACSPSGHFSVPLYSTRRSHLILFPFITLTLCITGRFTTPVVKATGFSKPWRSRIKPSPISLTCEARYEKSAGLVRRSRN